MIATLINPLPAFGVHVGFVALAAFVLGLFVHRRVFVVPIAFLAGSLGLFFTRHLYHFRAQWNDLFWEPVFQGHLLRHFPDAESIVGFVMHWLIPLGLAYWIAGRGRPKKSPRL